MSNLTLRSVKFDTAEKTQNRPAGRASASFQPNEHKSSSLMNLSMREIEGCTTPDGVAGGGAPPPPLAVWTAALQPWTAALRAVPASPLPTASGRLPTLPLPPTLIEKSLLPFPPD